MKLMPTIIKGAVHKDERGNLFYNNDFDARDVKRVYFIENENTSIIRGWQGHKIEQRWFSAVMGNYKIVLIKIDDWQKPSKNIESKEFIVNSNTLDVLHVPGGYITSIQALQEKSKLMVLTDFLLGEINDEYKYPQNYFENT